MRIYLENKNNDLICNENEIIHCNDIFPKIVNQMEYQKINGSFWGGININKYLCVFTSNKVFLNGEDKIIFYNLSSKAIDKIIKNYSFNVYQNNLCLISIENESNNKLLFCACKKYIKSQKNGILLLRIKIDNDDNIDISKIFYETGKFEVYCFCQIFMSENENSILKKNKMIGTKYFLVGGFDSNKLKGLIKLYKINYNNSNFDLTNIEYIQDIVIKKEYKNKSNMFKGFKGPITCIIQSSNNGNILITCYDGNVYLFSPPNIKSNSVQKFINKI